MESSLQRLMTIPLSCLAITAVLALSAQAQGISCTAAPAGEQLETMLTIVNTILYKEGLPPFEKGDCQRVADSDGKPASVFFFSGKYHVSAEISRQGADEASVLINDVPANRQDFYCWSSKAEAAAITAGRCGEVKPPVKRQF